MSTGKTTVGKLLAESIRYEFADTDLLIEEQQNMTIGDIVKTKGEDFFRGLENQVIRKLIKGTKPTVIALGSGSLMDVNNLKEVLDAGLLVRLNCDWSFIRERLRVIPDNPLLDSENPDITWNEHTINHQYAGFSIDITGKSPAQIMQELLPCVKNMNKLIAKQVSIE